MSDRAAPHPAVPSFDCALLDGMATALSKRAKAIKHKSCRFACTRRRASEGEWLEVELETVESKPTQLQLSVWEDGAMWLGVHQPNPSRTGGWAFAFEGKGSVATLTPGDVVAMLERTLAAVYGSTRAPDAHRVVEAVWEDAALQRER